MAVYTCPVCKQRSVSFEARSGVFACHMENCRKWFYSPTEAAIIASVAKADSSQRDAEQVQQWLNRQPPGNPPPSDDRLACHAAVRA